MQRIPFPSSLLPSFFNDFYNKFTTTYNKSELTETTLEAIQKDIIVLKDKYPYTYCHNIINIQHNDWLIQAGKLSYDYLDPYKTTSTDIKADIQAYYDFAKNCFNSDDIWLTILKGYQLINDTSTSLMLQMVSCTLEEKTFQIYHNTM